MTTAMLRSALVLTAVLAAGCAVYAGDGGPGSPPPGPPPGGPPPGRGAGPQPVRAQLGIPPGHLPPPGECRLWHPGRPPGQQPPPGKCGRILAEAPAAAWVLYRPAEEPEHVQVRVIDGRRPAVVIEIRLYEAASGLFLRAELP